MADICSSLGGVPRLHFSKERRQKLDSKGDDLVEKALTVYDEFHTKKKEEGSSDDWKLVKRKNSLSVYKERSKAKPYDDRNFLCSGVMPGTIEDMISGAYADDMESMRIGVSIMTHMFLDARMIHVFDKNPVTSSIVFSGIKWMALKTPTSASLIYDRDLLFYNRLGRIVDYQGRYFVYCIMDSVDLDEFPANRQQNLVRGSVSLCYLFRQVQDELIGCFIMGNSHMGGTLPRSVGEVITAERMLAVGNFLRVARAKAYSARIASSADRIPSTSNSCDVCMKKPNLLSGSFKLCMGCRRNTCRKCREWCTVFQLDLRTQKPGKEVFCTQCISDVTRPTVSTFYTRSLNESTNNSTSYHGSSSASVSTSEPKCSSSQSSSSQSHEFSEIDSDAWLPVPPEIPENLNGFADFIERASLADTKDQWNKDELKYYTHILHESGHYRTPSTTRQDKNQPSQSSTQGFHPDRSLPLPIRSGDKVLENYAADDHSVPHQKVFSVDELD